MTAQKILIIEDNAIYAQLLHDCLSPSYKVDRADNGMRGLELAGNIHPDLVLLDLGLPEIDGMAVLNALHKGTLGSGPKVILLTCQEADDAIIRQIAADPPTYYLVKDQITLEELVDKVQEALAG